MGRIGVKDVRTIAMHQDAVAIRVIERITGDVIAAVDNDDLFARGCCALCDDGAGETGAYDEDCHTS